MRPTYVYFAFLLTYLSASAQLPLDPVNCETETAPPVLDYPLGPRGAYKVLWVMCAPDSEALVPLDSLSIERPTCPAPTRRRVMYPSTYDLPPWASRMLDIDDDESLAKWYSETSFERFLIFGDVVGRPDCTIFLSDPDTSVRPLQPYTCWGNTGGSAFFRNILPKVDSVVNFSDYDLNNDGIVDFLVFDIYGLAEDGQFQGTGGVSALPDTFTSNDTTNSGEHIFISDGCVIWSPSPEAYVEFRSFSQDFAETQSYWENHVIAAHEIGHNIGGFTSHRAFLGCYEPMGAYGNFVDPVTWIGGPTSPYNPQYRLGFDWIDPIVVDRPDFSFELQDHLSSGEMLKIPAYRATTSDQYFLALASTRESTWERFYPSSGMMIYHIRPGGGGSDDGIPNSKFIDMELSTGLYSWTSEWQHVNPAWGCQPAPCSVLVSVNTLTPNSVSGLDSFDVEWVDGGAYPRTAFDVGHWGTRSNYYAEGDTFDYVSNPTSHGYSASSSYINQELPTMVHVSVSEVDTTNAFCTITAWSRHWRGTVSQNATWLDSVVVDSSVVVASGVELTILPGTKIVIDANATIRINGTLTANGASGSPITFRAKDNGETWSGMKIAGGSVDMDYVNMQDFRDYGIYTDAPTSVSIEHCHLDGSDLVSQAPALLLWNAPSVTQTVRYTTIENIPSGVGFYPYNSYVNLEYDTIRGCNNINSYIKKVSGHIHGCWFEGRTSTYAVYFNSSTCNPNLTCCTFKNLAPHSGSLQTTLYSANSCSPVFAGDYGTEAYPEKSNVIMDTSAYLLTFYGTGLKPTIHINDWYQNSANGKFMQWQNYPTPAVAFDVDRQYWNHAPSTAWFVPANAAYWDWTPNQNPAWLLCADDEPGGGSITMPGDLAGGGNSLDSDPTEQELLTDAMTLEASEDFESARDAFQALALAATASEVRWRAMVGCVTTDVRCAASAGWIEGYLDSLETLEGGGYQAHLDHTRILYNHYLNQVRYDEAIEECTSLLSSGLLPSDSIFVAVDLLGIQMAAGLVEYHGGLDGTVSPNIPQSLQVTSVSQGVTREFELLNTLNRASFDNELVHQPVLPTEFKLYQNYPNPFNPSTDIRFDLPEAIRVELKIFNILGQEVTTLVDDVRAAGAYRILWDGKNAAGLNVASGVYVYQIKTPNFQDAKKMLLIR